MAMVARNSRWREYIQENTGVYVSIFSAHLLKRASSFAATVEGLIGSQIIQQV